MGTYLDDRTIDDFRRDGFVAARGLAADVASFAGVVDAAVRKRKRYDGRSLAEKSLYEQSFLQCQYLWEDFPEIRPLTFHDCITGAAAELLGVPRLRLWHDQALFKEAGGRETDPHQDHAYWPIAETDTITAWIPLEEVTLESGAMGYVPGSHKIGSLEFADIFRDPGNESILDKPFVKAHPPVFVAAKPGDVLFHHGLTIHLAKPNVSARDRRVYTAIYFRDGAHRASAIPHPSVDRAGIAVEGVIDSAVTPVAWPLAGRFPEPVPWPAQTSKRGAMAAKLGIIPGEA